MSHAEVLGQMIDDAVAESAEKSKATCECGCPAVKADNGKYNCVKTLEEYRRKYGPTPARWNFS